MRKLKVSELGRKSIDEFKKAEKSPFVLVLDNVRSLNNIGSLFRTADALLAEGVYLCGITATPPHRDIHKTALGATDSVDWHYYEKIEDALRVLKEAGYIIVAIEQVDNSVPLQQFLPLAGMRYAFIFGHEVNGVSQEALDLSDISVEIPQFGTKHSLNISVSAGIVMWEFIRKIKFRDQA